MARTLVTGSSGHLGEALVRTLRARGAHVIGLVDSDVLITAGPQSPVQFACAALRRLGLASERTLDAYERLFDRGDASAFPVLADAQSK